MTLQLNRDLRTIQTARTVEAINAAAKNGFRPLVIPIRPSEAIRSKNQVMQNKETGEIEMIGDFRNAKPPPWEIVISDWYYPHHWELPFAAYLIPKDIECGERVWVEDLIEDLVGDSWNQGDAWRLDSCEAVWDGERLQLDYSKAQRSEIMG